MDCLDDPRCVAGYFQESFFTSDDALEDGLAVLRQRKAAIERDITGLDALLRQRRGEPVTVAPTSYADAAARLLAHLSNRGLS